MEGNQMKMREAMDAALRFIGNLEIEPYSPLDEAASELRQTIMDALSAPPSNCDVGTVKEQSDRFAEFCKKHDKGCGLGYGSKGIGHPKVTCPAFKDMECAIVWSQMPYEAEEGADA